MRLQSPESNIRRGRAGQPSAQLEIALAEEDYLRLRGAYVELAQMGHGNDVALAMVGADMQRAHVNLQNLGVPHQFPLDHEPTGVESREQLGRGEENI